jgi:hypothetical protein
MPHDSLRSPRCDAALAQVCAERVPQCVNIERPAAFVALRNVRYRNVAVKSANKVRRHVEQLGIALQTDRNGLCGGSGAFLRVGQ